MSERAGGSERARGREGGGRGQHAWLPTITLLWQVHSSRSPSLSKAHLHRCHFSLHEGTKARNTQKRIEKRANLRPRYCEGRVLCTPKRQDGNVPKYPLLALALALGAAAVGAMVRLTT
eukprot:6186314-Pleurochrysis_carterae.AAC.1